MAAQGTPEHAEPPLQPQRSQGGDAMYAYLFGIWCISDCDNPGREQQSFARTMGAQDDHKIHLIFAVKIMQARSP